MKSSKEMLSSIPKTTQMGQVGIRSVLERAGKATLKDALVSQLKEYDSLETEAHAIAQQRNWEVGELDPAVRKMADMMTRMKLTMGHSDSKIAGMMIEGNTKGMITGLKNLHQFTRQDAPISDLSRKLIDYENANITQMKAFL